jgi:hypothetical protein
MKQKKYLILKKQQKKSEPTQYRRMKLIKKINVKKDFKKKGPMSN